MNIPISFRCWNSLTAFSNELRKPDNDNFVSHSCLSMATTFGSRVRSSSLPYGTFKSNICGILNLISLKVFKVNTKNLNYKFIQFKVDVKMIKTLTISPATAVVMVFTYREVHQTGQHYNWPGSICSFSRDLGGPNHEVPKYFVSKNTLT